MRLNEKEHSYSVVMDGPKWLLYIYPSLTMEKKLYCLSQTTAKIPVDFSGNRSHLYTDLAAIDDDFNNEIKPNLFPVFRF